MLFAGFLIAVIRVKFLFHDNSHRPVLDTSINFMGYTPSGGSGKFFK
jgi:hypothetical protein